MGSLAYFVSTHGFGHAARACAVMTAILERVPQTRFEIFTEVPRWFFADSLPRCFAYHRVASDVGLVQRSPLQEDLQATVDRLDASPLWDQDALDRIARRVRRLRCNAVLADISPLGLAVAAQLGLPSVLVENFTWDWIYKGYRNAPDRLRHHGRSMAEVFALAGLRIQAEPACQSRSEAVAVPPGARAPRRSRTEVRLLLEVPENQPMVLLSMGGVNWDFGQLEKLELQDRAWIVVPGGGGRMRRRGRLLVMPFRAGVYHPDLVHASDLVVGKLGYSTVAEAYAAGTAFAFVARPRFRESAVLESFVHAHLNVQEITEEDLQSAKWLERVEHLLYPAQRRLGRADGSGMAAEAILDYLSM